MFVLNGVFSLGIVLGSLLLCVCTPISVAFIEIYRLNDIAKEKDSAEQKKKAEDKIRFALFHKLSSVAFELREIEK